MSELNEQVEEVVEDSPVVTIPLDETLTRHGEAADAKAVGDAIAGIQTNVTVNGQAKGADNDIKVGAEHVPYSTGVTVKQKLDAIDGKTADDIPMSSGQGAQTIAEAIDNAGAKSADQIPMAEGSLETVAERIDTIEDSVSDVEQALSEYEETTDSAIQNLQEADTELTDAEVHAIVNEVFGGGDE